MRLKNILKLFTVFLGVQSVCPLYTTISEATIVPNEELGQLDSVLRFYDYGHEYIEHLLAEALSYFGLPYFQSPSLLLLEKTDKNGEKKSQIDEKCGNLSDISKLIKSFLILDVDLL